MSVCRDCHATIKFVTLDTDTVMPVDPIAVPDGPVAATGTKKLTGFYLSKDKPMRDGHRRYMPHHATCHRGKPRVTAEDRAPSLFDPTT